MKKAERNCLYLKDGGEVHIGDILVKGDKLYVVDEEIIPVLIEQGVLCTKESLSEKKKDADDISRMIWLSMSIRLHRDLVGSQQRLATILIPLIPAIQQQHLPWY